MTPFERFKKLNTEGNLWIYVLTLGKEREVPIEELRSLIFEKFGFLPGNLLLKTVIFRLKNEGFISDEKFMGKKAFKTTEKGRTELEKMKQFILDLSEKIEDGKNKSDSL